MTVFSFTAPQITPGQEQSEREGVTNDELQQIESDLFGPSEIVETAEMIDSAFCRLQEAIEKIPDAKKRAYIEAMEVAPDLVENESPPLAFMRAEDHDADAAATRLVDYWKLRRKFFGAEKAFLPMTLSGAMRDDIEVLKTGFSTILPDDAQGRGVFFTNRTKIYDPYISRDESYRVAFYSLQMMSRRESVQKNGWVFLMNLEGFDIYKHMDRILIKTQTFLCKCMPIRVRATHMFCGRSSSVLGLAMPVLKFMCGRYNRLRMVMHGGQYKDYMESTKSYGLVLENLSHVVGGQYDHWKFLEWLSEQEGSEML